MSTKQENWQAFLTEIGRDSATVGGWDKATLDEAIQESSFKDKTAVDRGDIISSWRDSQGKEEQLLSIFTQNIVTAWSGHLCLTPGDELSKYTFLAWIHRSDSAGVAQCCTADTRVVVLKITSDQDEWERESQFLRKLGRNEFTVELVQEVESPHFKMYTLVFPHLHPFGQWRKLPADAIGIKSCFLQLLQALDYCHNVAGILHRDIKQSNILLTQLSPPHPVLADFGCSKWLAVFDDSICGTYRNMPPEWLHCLVDQTPYDIENETAADVWSLGIVFLEVVQFSTHINSFGGTLQRLFFKRFRNLQQL